MLENNPGKPVVLISIYPNSANYMKDPEKSKTNAAFVQKLRQIYESLKPQHPDLHYVDGHSLLTDFSALCVDLIHPSDYGHTLIGQRLAEALEEICG
jgi:lysophospholipase L1-like esterase